MTDDVAIAAADEAVVSEPVDTSPTPPDHSLRGSLDKAFDEAFQEDAPKEVEAEPAPKSERPRNADGTFKAAEGEAEQSAATETDEPEKPATEAEKPAQPVNFAEAPSRFSPDAKAAWKDAPEPVRAEITRAVKELEQGIEQYRQDFEPFREFAKELQQRGQQFGDVLNHYRGIEELLARDPYAGLDRICQNMGSSLRQVAAQVMGQTPDQNAASQDRTIAGLRQEIAALKQELNGVSTSIKSQSEQNVMREIEAFAADRPRFEELAPTIASLLQGNVAKDLNEAYSMAERLNPAPAPAPVQDPAPVQPAAIKPDRQAQTLKGQKSVTGAPSSGSNPANRKPPSSAADALDRAFDQVGL